VWLSNPLVCQDYTYLAYTDSSHRGVDLEGTYDDELVEIGSAAVETNSAMAAEHFGILGEKKVHHKWSGDRS